MDIMVENPISGMRVSDILDGRTRGVNFARGFRNKGEFNKDGKRFYFKARVTGLYYKNGVKDLAGRAILTVYEITEARKFSPGIERISGLPRPVLFMDKTKRKRVSKAKFSGAFIVAGTQNFYYRAVLADRLQNYLVDARGLVDMAFERIDKQVRDAYENN